MNFATLQGLTIPEGVVTEIKNANGVILWAGGGKAVLEVEKITSKTHVGETLHENQNFILLDVYPKKNGTVKVTYGGLTKTITDTSGAESPNAQEVFFGTFGGVSDDISTPSSGELTITGDYRGYGGGSFKTTSQKDSSPDIYTIKRIIKIGDIEMIPADGFSSLDQVGEFTIPIGCKSIGDSAFAWCEGITSVTSKSTNLSIDQYAFACCKSLESGIDLTKLNNLTKIPNGLYNSCDKLKGVIIPDTVTEIGDYAFGSCKGLDGITIPSSVTSIGGGALTSMTHVFIKATTPPVISSSTFSNGTTLHVPVGCGNAYRNAQYYNNYTIVEG